MKSIKVFLENEVCIIMMMIMPLIIFFSIFTDDLAIQLKYSGIVIIMFGILRLALYLMFNAIIKALVDLKEKKGIWIQFRSPIKVTKIRPIR